LYFAIFIRSSKFDIILFVIKDVLRDEKQWDLSKRIIIKAFIILNHSKIIPIQKIE